ncbi:response regulator transcription factor [Waterburya agarophytonicola K14]|uniref:Response regulator transcription factor n=1 Tax=Waterburya agarophytonicola KI4 TaxID=2874699 RepID=A0A964BVQ9_9CYAN|nr:response regulator transcription factor [Waterburya agarophytonicola]MCC0178580.1 response regulator transcription factor [Waterburya agarophytonicola KI4]
MISVLVVDDQNLTHRLIETYLKSEAEIEIVGFANNGQDAIEQIRNLQPDVVLMDVEMPKMDGLAATKIITREFVTTKVLILTVHDNEAHLSLALENGAKGYLLKTTTSQELKNAIYYVNQGYFQLSVELTEKYLQKIVKAKPESEEIFEIKKKVSYLSKSFNKLEDELEKSGEKNLEENLERKIEGLLQKEMAILRDRDSHLQFKVDRMKYNQERLEQNIKYLFKVQMGCIIVALMAIILAAFSVFN